MKVLKTAAETTSRIALMMGRQFDSTAAWKKDSKTAWKNKDSKTACWKKGSKTAWKRDLKTAFQTVLKMVLMVDCRLQ
jgi:hypothetical protein